MVLVSLCCCLVVFLVRRSKDADQDADGVEDVVLNKSGVSAVGSATNLFANAIALPDTNEALDPFATESPGYNEIRETEDTDHTAGNWQVDELDPFAAVTDVLQHHGAQGKRGGAAPNSVYQQSYAEIEGGNDAYLDITDPGGDRYEEVEAGETGPVMKSMAAGPIEGKDTYLMPYLTATLQHGEPTVYHAAEVCDSALEDTYAVPLCETTATLQLSETNIDAYLRTNTPAPPPLTTPTLPTPEGLGDMPGVLVPELHDAGPSPSLASQPQTLTWIVRPMFRMVLNI